MIKIVDMPRRTGKTVSAIEALDNNEKAIMLVPNLKYRDSFYPKEIKQRIYSTEQFMRLFVWLYCGESYICRMN